MTYYEQTYWAATIFLVQPIPAFFGSSCSSSLSSHVHFSTPSHCHVVFQVWLKLPLVSAAEVLRFTALLQTAHIMAESCTQQAIFQLKRYLYSRELPPRLWRWTYSPVDTRSAGWRLPWSPNPSRARPVQVRTAGRWQALWAFQLCFQKPSKTFRASHSRCTAKGSPACPVHQPEPCSPKEWFR